MYISSVFQELSRTESNSIISSLMQFINQSHSNWSLSVETSGDVGLEDSEEDDFRSLLKCTPPQREIPTAAILAGQKHVHITHTHARRHTHITHTHTHTVSYTYVHTLELLTTDL